MQTFFSGIFPLRGKMLFWDIETYSDVGVLFPVAPAQRLRTQIADTKKKMADIHHSIVWAAIILEDRMTLRNKHANKGSLYCKYYDELIVSGSKDLERKKKLWTSEKNRLKRLGKKLKKQASLEV